MLRNNLSIWGSGEGAESAEELQDESLGATETNF